MLSNCYTCELYWTKLTKKTNRNKLGNQKAFLLVLEKTYRNLVSPTKLRPIKIEWKKTKQNPTDLYYINAKTCCPRLFLFTLARRRTQSFAERSSLRSQQWLKRQWPSEPESSWPTGFSQGNSSWVPFS